MKSLNAGIIVLVLAFGATWMTESTAAAQQLAGSGMTPPILNAMIGRWDVEQTMWTGPDAAPTKMPAAVAVRRMAAGGGFLDEEMTLAVPSDQPFTRTSHLNFNVVNGLFEYMSVDSRAPQQMHYQSQAAAPKFRGTLEFMGGTFVAAQWGDKKDIAFAYRMQLSPVENNRQTLRLFLRALVTGNQSEFLAFQYNYRMQ